MGILFYAIIANGAHPRSLSTWDVSVSDADRMFIYDRGFDEDVTMWNFPDGLPASAMDRMFRYADAWKAKVYQLWLRQLYLKHAACSEFTSAGNTYSSSKWRSLWPAIRMGAHGQRLRRRHTPRQRRHWQLLRYPRVSWLMSALV